jgi:hypothetical protein
LGELLHNWRGRLLALAAIAGGLLAVVANAAQVADFACARFGLGCRPTPTHVPAAQVIIQSIESDPPGDPVAGEHVLLANTGSAPAELAGWTLCDAKDHCYLFPAARLEAGAALRVWTGGGAATPADLYWGSTVPVWNNEGDVATLRDAGDGLVCEYRY